MDEHLAVTVEEATDGASVGAGVTIVSKVGDRTIQFSTALPRDASLGQYNSLMDKLIEVCERQEAKILLGDVQRSILSDEEQLEQAKEEIPLIEVRAEALWRKDERKKGPFVLSDSDKARQLMLANNIHKLKGTIANKQIAVDELRGKIAKGA
jgi:hypothetical protein